MERLSGMDAAFLYLETPSMPMHVTLCAVLDPTSVPGGEGWDFHRVRAHIGERVPRIPALGRRLMPVPLRLHHPVWIDDPDFSVDAHVHRAALPAPGGEAELKQFVAQVAALPLDRARPLWEMWLVEGLDDGRVALVAKVHHAAVDGVAGVEELIHLFDLAAEGEGDDGAFGTGRTEAPGRPHVDPVPTDVELLAYAAASRVKGLLEVVPLMGRTATGIFAVRNRRREGRDPLASEALLEDDPPARAGTPLACPPTPFNAAITGTRTVAFARISLDEVKAVRKAAGATVNDVILAVCAGALRRYLLHHDALPVEPLVAACPVNVRTADQSGTGQAGNRVSAMFALLRTDLHRPIDRLEGAMRTAAAAKEEHGLFDPEMLQQWTEVLDPNLAIWLSDAYSSSNLAGRHRPAINVMISNVPGPPFPLYLAGARLERAYPMGQIIEGVGLNITVMSYCEWVDIGIMAAANLVPDVDLLASFVAPALTELTSATVP